MESAGDPVPVASANGLDRYEAAVESLYLDWQAAADNPAGPWTWSTVVEPGPIALRARWQFLRGLRPGADPRIGNGTSRRQWRAELEAETSGDAALVAHDLDMARTAFTTLLDQASHPVVRVQAMIGLGDVLRYEDRDIDRTVSTYSDAADLADRHGYAFGAMRARLPLAYLIRRNGSAEQMLKIATDCETAARDLDDRVYIANALVAKGEALDLLGHVSGNRDLAVQVLSQALDMFTQLGSQPGIGSAGLRLLDVYRRRLDSAAIVNLAPTVLRATQATGQLMETIDSFDTLAFAHNELEQFDEALDVCRRGIETAGSRYPRGIANLSLSLGMALRRSGDPDQAIAAYTDALTFYQPRDERWMVAFCLGQLALCAEDLGSNDDAVTLQLRAINEIEGIRARQTTPRWQQEYRHRFDITYRAAMLTMLRIRHSVGFVAVFESLWGRRLPGLTGGVGLNSATDPLLIAQLLAQNERARRSRLSQVEQTRDAQGPDGQDPAAATDALGTEELRGQYTAATETALAATFTPMADEEAAALLDAAPDDIAILLIAEIPGVPRTLAWLTKLPQEAPTVGSRPLRDDECSLIDAWSAEWPRNAGSADVAGLAGLIPQELAAAFANDSRDPLLIVPLEKLWGLPWPALRTTTRANSEHDDPARQSTGPLLGATRPIAFSPSLTLALKDTAVAAVPGGATQTRASDTTASRAARPADSTTIAAIGPGVRWHDLRALGESTIDPRSPAAARAAYKALTGDTSTQAEADPDSPAGPDHRDKSVSPTSPTVVVVGHGRPTPGLGHYLELSPELSVTPTQLLNATPPPSLALVACWGAYLPGESTGEPITLATIALARGSRQILTTRTELGDTPTAAAVVNDTVHHARATTWAQALHQAIAMRHDDLADEPLVNWAALMALGGTR